MKWYLSGPMAGYPQNNFPAFTAAESALTDLGLEVLSPHTINHSTTTQWADFLRRDIAFMLDSCSGLILIHGWPQSRGARLELSTALALDWPVRYWDGMQLHDMNKDR